METNATMSSTSSGGRPPLVLVGKGRRAVSSTLSLDPNYYYRIADGQDFEDDVENQFDLIHVKLTIYGLSGIVSQLKEARRRFSRPRPFSSPKRVYSPMMRKNLPLVSNRSEGSSTISTKEGLYGDDLFFLQVPTTAIVVFERKAMSSQSSMFTYIPSLPLGIPSSPANFRSQYTASWPADLPSSVLNQENNALERSSITFARVMKRESFLRGQVCHSITTYVPETIDFFVHLGRGKEMVPLGTASLVITGDEESEVQLDLPVKPFPFRNTQSLKALKACRRKPSFSDDSSRVFSLDENARIRIGLQVTPHQSILDANARKQHEKEMMNELAAFDRKLVEEISVVPAPTTGEEIISLTESTLDAEARSTRESSSRNMGNGLKLEEKSDTLPPLKMENALVVLSPQSHRPPNFFCSAVICDDRRGDTDNHEAIYDDRTMQYFTFKSERRDISFRESSVMSSISESTDESEDVSDIGRLINRKIVLQKRRPTGTESM